VILVLAAPPSVNGSLLALVLVDVRDLRLQAADILIKGIDLVGSGIDFACQTVIDILNVVVQVGLEGVNLRIEGIIEAFNGFFEGGNLSFIISIGLDQSSIELLDSSFKCGNLSSELSILVSQLTSDCVQLGIHLLDEIDTGSAALIILSETLSALTRTHKKIPGMRGQARQRGQKRFSC